MAVGNLYDTISISVMISYQQFAVVSVVKILKNKTTQYEDINTDTQYRANYYIILVYAGCPKSFDKRLKISLTHTQPVNRLISNIPRFLCLSIVFIVLAVLIYYIIKFI